MIGTTDWLIQTISSRKKNTAFFNVSPPTTPRLFSSPTPTNMDQMHSPRGAFSSPNRKFNMPPNTDTSEKYKDHLSLLHLSRGGLKAFKSLNIAWLNEVCSDFRISKNMLNLNRKQFGHSQSNDVFIVTCIPMTCIK
jgi:hypothetical protein